MTSSASPESRSGHGPLVEITNLTKWFAVKQSVFASVKGVVHAVEDVTLTVNRGETLGIVGESGCGKSTTARLMVKLLDATSGTVKFDGEDITNYSMRQMRPLRRQMQMIFQDPYSSLNPRKSVGQIIGEPFTIHKTEKDVRSRVQELLARVGLSPEHYNRYPHEFSGGQRQRIGVARAIALQPKLIVCDEPVSALDVSVQAQILNLLKGLQRDFDLTYVFISHDLSVIRQVSDRVAVMYLGRVVELSDSELLYDHPRHPYTAALLSAVPRPTVDGNSAKNRVVLTGDVPSPVNPPEACVFHPRCPRFQDGKCNVDLPELQSFGPHHEAACHFPVERWPLTAEELAHPFASSTPKSEFPCSGRSAPNYRRRYSSEGINDTLAANNGLRAGLTVDFPRTRPRTRPARAGRARTPSRAVRPVSRRECGVPRVHRADARSLAGGARSTGCDPGAGEIGPRDDAPWDGDRSCRGRGGVRRVQRRTPLGRPSPELFELRKPSAATGVRAGASADRADLLRCGPAGVGSPVRRARASIDSPSGRRLYSVTVYSNTAYSNTFCRRRQASIPGE